MKQGILDMMKGSFCSHVHFRDEEWSYKYTIAEGLALMGKLGFIGVGDMPNNKPLTIDRKGVERRLALVPPNSPVQYFTYVGLTKNLKQVAEAVWCWRNFSQVLALKMFAGESTGDMTVREEDAQRAVYGALAEAQFPGVLALHCEKEGLLRKHLWDSDVPTSHSLVRQKWAEVMSIKDQINFAIEAGFTGTLHVCHVSCPESVNVIRNARKSYDIKITCGATPHHLLFSTAVQEQLRSFGHFLKMNPPLRSEEDRILLMQHLIDGHIDFIETDHAPHTLSEKLSETYASGVPSLHLYGDLLEDLSENLSPVQIRKLTFGNIVKAFSPKLDHLLK